MQRHHTSTTDTKAKLADLYWRLQQVDDAIRAMERVHALREGRRRTTADLFLRGRRAERSAARRRGAAFVTLWKQAQAVA